MRTKREVYLSLFRYWLKIFALAFAMGVVSGIVLSYQFGSNWSVFADKAGPVIGPLMAYEVMTAFFLEAGPPRASWAWRSAPCCADGGALSKPRFGLAEGVPRPGHAPGAR